MNISKWTAAGAVLAILLVGYAFGRFATPSKVLERDHIVTAEHDTELTWHAYVGHTESKVETKTNWQTVTKWLPGGTVTQIVQAAQDHTANINTNVAENDGKVKEVVKYVDIEKVKIIESARPDWLISGQVGSRLDGWKPVYGGEVARRIVGPVFVGAWAQASGLERTGAAAGLNVVLLF